MGGILASQMSHLHFGLGFKIFSGPFGISAASLAAAFLVGWFSSVLLHLTLPAVDFSVLLDLFFGIFFDAL